MKSGAPTWFHVSFQVQGVGSKGWRDVTTFFSGKAEDTSDR